MIADAKLSGVNALSASFQAGTKNFFPIIGLLIVNILISFVGALGCGIGIISVLPIINAASFSAYQSVFDRPRFENQFQQPPPPPIFDSQSDNNY